MISKATCPDCGADVVHSDNNVLLDRPAVEYDSDPLGACWTLMPIAGKVLASVGSPGIGNKGHTLHEHQPFEGKEW